MLVMALYNVIDTFFVAGLPNGRQAIAGLTVVFPLQMVAGALGVGAGIGVASLVARRFGEQRTDEVRAIAGTAVTLPLVLGGALLLTARLAPYQLLHVFGVQPDIVVPALTYLTTVSVGFPFVLFNMTVGGLLRGAGDAVMPMVIMATSAGLNVILAPLLINGIGPFPRLEVFGAALATVIAQVASFCLTVGYMLSGRSGYRLGWRHLGLRWHVLRGIAVVGAPAAAMQIAQSVVVSVFNWVLGRHGSGAIAAYGMTFRILMLIFPWVFGVSQGLLPIVGYNFGARQHRRMWRAVRIAATWTGALGFLLSAAMWIAAPRVVNAFTNDAELLEVTPAALRLILLTLGFVAPQIMAVTALQGMGFGAQAMVLSLTRQLLFLVPGLLVLSHLFGVMGAFAAHPVADALSFAVTGLYVWGVWRRFRHAEGRSLVQPAESGPPTL